MTTFTTRNQSKRHTYAVLTAAGVFLAIIVTVIVVYRENKRQQMFRGYDVKNSERLAATPGRKFNTKFRSKAEELEESNRIAAELNKNENSDTNSNSNNNIDINIYNRKESISYQNKQQPTLDEPYYPSESVLRESFVIIPHNGGPIKGQVRMIDTPSGQAQPVVSYLGVPYALPPINDLRFESPKSTPPWTVPRAAFRQPPKCPQGSYLFSTITETKSAHKIEDEDCLYLNIWTPESEDFSAKKPVLVYLHSGLFGFGSIGSRDFDGTNLSATHDILVVTVQYRLGALGFASFDPDNTDSHYNSIGLQDQVKALEWIRANIGAFGGDPQRITLAGHGAGAVAIGAHLLNPQTSKMFQRAIVQGVHNLWNVGLYGLNTKTVHFLVNDIGCELTAPTSKLWKKCIKKLKIHLQAIIETQQFQMERIAVPFGPEFNPFTQEVVEQMNKMGNITEKPTLEQLKMLFGGWNVFPEHIELMIGLNSDDDFALQSINKNNSAVSFNEEEDDEDEEEDDEEEGNEENEENEKEEEKVKKKDDDEDKTMMIASSSDQTTTNKMTNDDDDKNGEKEDGHDEEGEEEEEGNEEEGEEESGEEEEGKKGDKKAESNNQNKDVNHPGNSSSTTTTTSAMATASTSPTSTMASSTTNAKDENEDEDIENKSDSEEESSSDDNNDNDNDDDEIMIVPNTTTTTMAPTTTQHGTSMVQRRRRRRRRQISDTEEVTLEPDEKMKLCRLVNMYQQQWSRDKTAVSTRVYLYRVDPKVLQSPLEEVSIAFGAKQKRWLIGFDQHLMSLWGQFAKHGSVRSVEQLSKFSDSGLPSSVKSDQVRLIHLGLMDSMNDRNKTTTGGGVPGETTAMKNSKMMAKAEMANDDDNDDDDLAPQNSELKVVTVKQLKKLCSTSDAAA